MRLGMSYAVRHTYIGHNPLREAERPGEQAKGHEEGDRITILTPELIVFLGPGARVPD
jgi:hypothetical protein